jgi:hypothetical protein
MMSYHIKNVFADNELDRKSNIQKMYIAGSDKPVSLHSLDVIISVGYRVKSTEGVHFRRWATTILRERLLKAHRQRQTEHHRLETLGKLATHVSSIRRERPCCHRALDCGKRAETERRGAPAHLGDVIGLDRLRRDGGLGSLHEIRHNFSSKLSGYCAATLTPRHLAH